MATQSTKSLELSDADYAEMMDVSLLAAKRTESTELSAEQAAIVSGSLNKSDKIRQLLASGLKRGAVAKALNIRYQHVRNVEITPLKKK